MDFLGKINEKLYNSYAGLKHSLTSTFQTDDDGHAKDRRLILKGTLLSGIVSNMTMGTFFTGLTLIILSGETEKVRNAYLGNITILQFLCGMAQLLSPFILEKLDRRRGYVIAMRILYHFSNIIFLGVIPLLPFNATVKADLLMVAIVLMYTSLALATPGLSIWQLGSLPDQHRANYYATQNMIATLVSSITSVLCSAFIDAFKSNGQELTAILILRGLAILVATWETKSFFDVAEPIYAQDNGNKLSFKSILTVPFRHPAFLLMVLIAALWNLAVNLPGQYYTAFVLTDAKVSYTYMGIANFCGIPFSILMTPLWNKMINRYGWLRPMALSVGFYIGTYFFNVAVTEHTQFFVILGIIFYQCISPGVTLGITNLPYLKIPKEGQSSCLAFFNTICSLATLGGSVLARQFIQWTDGIYLNLFGWQIKNSSYINLVSAVLLLPIIVLVLLVYRKDKRKGNTEQRAMVKIADRQNSPSKNK